eukprot:1039261-Prorocentrum_minimum.AAC.2
MKIRFRPGGAACGGRNPHPERGLFTPGGGSFTPGGGSFTPGEGSFCLWRDITLSSTKPPLRGFKLTPLSPPSQRRHFAPGPFRPSAPPEVPAPPASARPRRKSAPTPPPS